MDLLASECSHDNGKSWVRRLPKHNPIPSIPLYNILVFKSDLREGLSLK